MTNQPENHTVRELQQALQAAEERTRAAEEDAFVAPDLTAHSVLDNMQKLVDIISKAGRWDDLFHVTQCTRNIISGLLDTGRDIANHIVSQRQERRHSWQDAIHRRVQTVEAGAASLAEGRLVDQQAVPAAGNRRGETGSEVLDELCRSALSRRYSCRVKTRCDVLKHHPYIRHLFLKLHLSIALDYHCAPAA